MKMPITTPGQTAGQTPRATAIEHRQFNAAAGQREEQEHARERHGDERAERDARQSERTRPWRC